MTPEPFLSPDSPLLADEAGSWHSAYLHIPFCGRVCPYCDFAVVAGRDDVVADYLVAVEREIDDEPPWRQLDAVFVGGGTPSRLDPADLGRLTSRLRARFGMAPDAEVSLEANPEDWTGELAEGLVESGFNRVSFGVQSFDPAVLRSLGRCHAPGDAVRAVEIARAAGFGSVSVDLIFGTPGESPASWEASVVVAAGLDVDHVSTYGLTVEPATPLGLAVRRGAASPDPDLQADMWELACEVLSGAGLVRYEVSNHARPGHPCRYNLSVWDQGEYLAFGLGAHSFRDGMRRRNVRRLDTYIDRTRRGIGPNQAGERIEGWPAEQERLMLGLRRTAGARIGPGGRALLASDPGRRLVEAGVMTVTDDRLIVSNPLLTDAVIREVLALPEPHGVRAPGA